VPVLPLRLEVLAHGRGERCAGRHGQFGRIGGLSHGRSKTDEDEYTILTRASLVLILSIDTTTRAGSAAVLRDDTLVAVAEGDPSRTHGERLPAELEAVLRLARIELADVDVLAVARGPGAFTGLRIGLAAMQGVAMVTGRPVIGVSALEALAAAAFERLLVTHARIGVWMDAARGEIFAAAYDAAGEVGGLPALAPLTEPEVDAPEAVWARWQAMPHPPGPDRTRPHPPATWTFTGDGASRYAPVLGNAQVATAGPLAPAIARLARRMADHGSHTPHDLQPLYVRRPDAERGGRT
jgi:tRNA threonylcarbamoyladenosine biosynthesis protein TsaB